MTNDPWRADPNIRAFLEGVSLSSASPGPDTEATQQTFSRLLGCLPGFMYRCRNVPEWSIEFISANVEAITGWSPQELVDDDLVSYGTLIHAEDRQRVWNAVQQAIDEDVAYHVAYRLSTRDGGIRYVQEHGHPVQVPDGQMMLEGLVLHTDASHDFEQLLHNRRHLDAMAGTVASLAHDFNNLLGVILGSADLAAESLAEGHPAQNDLESIIDSTRRAGALSRKLLAFGRQEPSQPRPVRLDAGLDALRALIERVAGDADLAWDLRAGEASTELDPSDLERVAVNAVSNARDAGTDTLRIESYVAAERQPGTNPWFRWEAGDYVVLAVSDQGTGIAPEDLQRIFEPRFSTREGDRGLGLASCHGILAKCGGFIHVITHPGAGSTFEFHFPRVASTGQAVEPRRRTRRHQVVVYQPGGPALPLARMLASAGFAVEEMEHADQVVDHCRNSDRPPLVIAALPRWVQHESGLHERVAEACPDAPLIYVVASMEPELQRALHRRRIRVLTLPFTRSDLVAVVSEHMASDGE